MGTTLTPYMQKHLYWQHAHVITCMCSYSLYVCMLCYADDSSATRKCVGWHLSHSPFPFEIGFLTPYMQKHLYWQHTHSIMCMCSYSLHMCTLCCTDDSSATHKCGGWHLPHSPLPFEIGFLMPYTQKCLHWAARLTIITLILTHPAFAGSICTELCCIL